MAEELAGLCASGGQLHVKRLLSFTPSLPGKIHCQALHKHCFNYISKVAVVKGVKRRRRHREVQYAEAKGIKKKNTRRKEKNGIWTGF